MDDPPDGGPAVPRGRVRLVGTRLVRGRQHPHAVRLRGPFSCSLWFFQWPATALAHLHNPLYYGRSSTRLGWDLWPRPRWLGLRVPLVPVTWIWGPVAALNVASTLCPRSPPFLLSWWCGAGCVDAGAFAGGLFYGFSPFVLTSLQFAHLMTAAVMVLPLILAVLDEIIVRQRHETRSGPASCSGCCSSVSSSCRPSCWRIAAVVVVVCRGGAGDRRAGRPTLAVCGLACPTRPEHWASALGLGAVLLAWPVWFALEGPAPPAGPGLARRRGDRRLHPLEFRHDGVPVKSCNSFLPLEWVRGCPAGFLGLSSGGASCGRHRRRPGRLLAGPAFVVLLPSPWPCAWPSLWASGMDQWGRRGSSPASPCCQNVIEQRFMAIGYLAATVPVGRHHGAGDLPRRAGLAGCPSARWRRAGSPWCPWAVLFSERLPFTMQAVVAPTLVQRGGADPARGGGSSSTYPAPFSGIQSSMAWQAVRWAFQFSVAGGGGPAGSGTPRRHGHDRGSRSWPTSVSGGWSPPAAEGTAARLGRGPPCPVGLAGHHRGDGDLIVPLPTHRDRTGPRLCGGLHDRRPRAACPPWRPAPGSGTTCSWRAPGPLDLKAGTLATCTAAAEGQAGLFEATMQLPECVAGACWEHPEGAGWRLKAWPGRADEKESGARVPDFCGGRSGHGPTDPTDQAAFPVPGRGAARKTVPA